MAIQRKQREKSGILPLVAHLSHTKSCEDFCSGKMTPGEQRETAELAYRMWLARAFRSGSPQEDWIKAVRQRSEGQ